MLFMKVDFAFALIGDLMGTFGALLFEVGAMESSMWCFRGTVGDTNVQWVHCWNNMRIYGTVGTSQLLFGA